MKYRKRPIVIEAFLWTGRPSQTERPNWIIEAIKGGYAGYDPPDRESLWILTLEGRMRAIPGDYIIRGIGGEIYPCRPDIFSATYEALPEDE